MKKIPLLIALGIFSLLAAVVFIYDFKLEKKRTPWDFIGQNVVLVYVPPESPNEFIQGVFKEATKDFLDSSIQGNLIHLIAGRNSIASLHITAKNNFDFAFYAPLSSGQEKKQLTEFQRLLTSKKTEQRQRTFDGVVIYEIVLPTKRIFSYAVIDDVLIASSTSFLVEDAVRVAIAEDPQTFRKENSKLFQLSTLDKDDGDLYVNLPEFFRWAKLFSNRNIVGLDFPFGRSLITDFKIDDGNAQFNGFATDSLGNSFLDFFNNQTPVDFGMKSVISTNSSAVLHYGISKPESWYHDRDIFIKRNRPSMKDSIEGLSVYKFNSLDFFKSMDNEAALTLIDHGSTSSSVFIVELKNTNSGLLALESISKTLSIQNKDSIYSYPYSSYTIRKIDLPNFTYTLFWPLADKSPETYFTIAGNYVIFSESDELLKQYLDDIDEENTWNKSLRWNTFLQTSLQESNIDLFFDINLLSLYLSDRLTSRWKTYFESTHFLSVDRGAIQFSRLEQLYYFTGNFPLKENTKSPKTSKPFTNINLPNDLISKPFLVKNHTTGNSEIIVQDTLNVIYLIGPNGKIEWKLNLDSKIMGEVAQVDFYKNSKLQSMFVTKDKIHIVDRLGRYITGFPKTVPSKSLQFSSVVDYDKSKNYRFLASDHERKIYILDKEGNILEGWNPKQTQRNLFAPARHYRILGKDYFVAIQDDGLVFVTNRRGESIKGFPLALHVRPQGDWFFEGGKDFSSCTFAVISNEGTRVQFNLLGKIVGQDALIKTNIKSRFYLLVSDDRKVCSFARIDPGKIAAFDQRGRLLFEKENPASESLLPHMFNFDSGKRIFSFTDTVQKLSYALDEQGNYVLSSPIETSQVPALSYNQRTEELKIFWTNESILMSTSLHWPN